MKKILILVLAFIVIGIAYMVKNGTVGIMSSVLIGAQKYPDGTPTSLETALITPDGFYSREKPQQP